MFVYKQISHCLLFISGYHIILKRKNKTCIGFEIITSNSILKMLRNANLLARFSSKAPTDTACGGEKIQNLAKKLREKTPIGKLDELDEGKHPFQEKEPLPPFPDGINPTTGEVGGPRGPEPTRYGDWERKGRVTDF